jgi:hypothetical protein
MKPITALITALLSGILVAVRAPSALDNGRKAPTAAYANVARGKPYTFSVAPNYPFCTDPADSVQLTDGNYTSGYFWTQKGVVGWQKRRPIIVTIDLGQVEPIRGVSYNTAAGTAGVEWPRAIFVLVSDDGKSYHAICDLVARSDVRDPPPAIGYGVHLYWVDDLKTHGRYVQLLIDAGGPFCFVDEIEVYRGQDVWMTLPFVSEVITDSAIYFKRMVLDDALRRRLRMDLAETRALALKAGEKASKIAMRELASIEEGVATMMPTDPTTFRAVFPVSDLHARIFALQGKMKQMAGEPALQAWTCHPLDYLSPNQGPRRPHTSKLSLAMMRGEWRSAVLNLTNSTGSMIKAKVRLEGLPGGVPPEWVEVKEVLWTDTKEMKPIGVALPQAKQDDGGFAIAIPGGMTRQLWLSFHPVGIEPGTHRGHVEVIWKGGEPLTIPLTIDVSPMMFPKRPTLHVGGWDYTSVDSIYGVTPANRDALVAHLKDRFVDSPWATAAVLPSGPAEGFNAKGELVRGPDTAAFDDWSARWPEARRYCVFMSVGASIAGSTMNTPRFDAIVGSWITYWVEHARTRGIKPEQLVLLLVDEPSQNQQDEVIVAWATAIRAAQPKVVLWEDPAYLRPWEALSKMMSSVDVLCPNRNQMLSAGKPFEDFYRKQKADGRRLEFCSGGPTHLLDPYSYVRLQAWTCWDMGAEATLFWAFGDTGGGNPWNPYDSPASNGAPMFLAPDSVMPGKHMEALRESVEDFEYFVMLKAAVAKANPNHPALAQGRELLATGVRRVLDAPGASKMSWFDEKDRSVADAVRLEILRVLEALEN